MKRVLFLLLTVLLVLSLVACGEDAPSKDTSGPESNYAGESADTEPDIETVRNMIGQPVSALYELIGQPNDSSYASSCMGSGDDGELYYEAFTVVTYREGDSENIVDVY